MIQSNNKMRRKTALEEGWQAGPALNVKRGLKKNIAGRTKIVGLFLLLYHTTRTRRERQKQVLFPVHHKIIVTEDKILNSYLPMWEKILTPLT